MRAKVYFARHAETIANRDNILQGHCDFPLTPEGEEHSRALGEHLKDKAWRRVFSSDLQRALSSCHNVLSRSTTVDPDHVVQTPLLREVSFGVREGLSRSLTKLEALELKAAQLGIPVEHVVDHAETPEQVKVRQLEFVKYLFEDLCTTCAEDPEPLVLCISHGAYIRRFLNNFCANPIEKISNCSISIVSIVWKSPDEFECRSNPSEVNVSWEAIVP